jgi:dihydroorotate dehydrogenase
VYETILRPLLFCLEPETAHHLALRCLEIFGRVYPYRNTHVGTGRGAVELFGIRFPNRVGLAAGFDKNGVALPAWAVLGFGFVEVGTVTTVAQPGNPRPRIFRVTQREALINRLGFNNEGAEVIAARLRALRQRGNQLRIPVGINIGKNRVTPLAKAPEDYLAAFRQLREVGDYFVLNISSPNTPGLRELQSYRALRDLLAAIQAEAASKPVLVKVAPDLSEAELNGIIELAEAQGLAGLVATNTTINQESVSPKHRTEGGLSGAPLRDRAMSVLQLVRKKTSLPVIAVGGIMSVADAAARFAAGADLVQIYTGFIYHGPGLVKAIARLDPP